MKIKESVSTFANDTLKKTGSDGVIRWDYVKITMFVSFVIANCLAIYATYKYGFKFEVFFTYMVVAITGKIAGNYSKVIKDK